MLSDRLCLAYSDLKGIGPPSTRDSKGHESNCSRTVRDECLAKVAFKTRSTEKFAWQAMWITSPPTQPVSLYNCESHTATVWSIQKHYDVSIYWASIEHLVGRLSMWTSRCFRSASMRLAFSLQTFTTTTTTTTISSIISITSIVPVTNTITTIIIVLWLLLLLFSLQNSS